MEENRTADSNREPPEFEARLLHRDFPLLVAIGEITSAGR
jgi:hypothetical protein